ncbi:lytic transglycosylase domain-containing protein [Chromobacterium haemolyticum]|uniref:lytic transglycosylase domain-containing protein n=1 Tax=Chromobacterium haemolyticum TaxID=394935 RepID=UPI00244B6A73|nr:lytic transglycosylase domain-containing protein [Chromobacterium haemolyticum]MDH0342145.1 lytic transglycosylase domain-containing protein [Chromobacterium haemolyticum]
MDMPALPPSSAREVCIIQAAARYQENPVLIRAVLRVENGKVGQIRWNKNGTFDMGPMQINSIHLPELAPYGITEAKLTNDECLNIHIGTYYVKKNILAGKDFWHGVGSYHSKTPSKNIAYQYRVWNQVQIIQGAPR